ncbi:type I toxin-antitoxin system Fst family toxin [Enterococcus faecium]
MAEKTAIKQPGNKRYLKLPHRFNFVGYNNLSPIRQSCDWKEVYLMFELFICPLLVGVCISVFSYWLNNRNKK